jgi:hypothetical protein
LRTIIVGASVRFEQRIPAIASLAGGRPTLEIVHAPTWKHAVTSVIAVVPLHCNPTFRGTSDEALDGLDAPDVPILGLIVSGRRPSAELQPQVHRRPEVVILDRTGRGKPFFAVNSERNLI